MRLTACVLAAVACAAAPAPAAAADVATDLPCYLPGTAVALAGEGWTPGAAWTVDGGVDATGVVDAGGLVTAAAVAPALDPDRRTPKTFDVTATDGTQTATTTLRVVNGGAVWSDGGAPRTVVRWSFGGLTSGKPVYVHVLRGSKVLKTTRAGRASGPCGTASKRLRRLPVNPRAVRDGVYTIAVDDRRRYRPGGPYEYRYVVRTTPRR